MVETASIVPPLCLCLGLFGWLIPIGVLTLVWLGLDYFWLAPRAERRRASKLENPDG